MRFIIRELSNLSSHPDYRWDSEFLCFEPYKNETLEYVSIGSVLTSTQYGISISMNEDEVGTKIYRMNEISNVICDRNISKFAEISASEVASYKLEDRDVLFNRTNSQAFVGRTGIFRKFSDEDIVFASYLVRVNPNPKIVAPEYLTAFLNTKYGVLDVKRRARISINQSNVNPEELKRVEIPLLSDELQSEITFSYDKVFSLIQASEANYHQAQTHLLSELGLANWQPQHRLTFVRNYSDTQRAGRIDAEHFQPKYEDMLDAVEEYPGGWDTLGSLVYVKDRNDKPENKTECRYIELTDIGDTGEITDCMVEEGQDLPSRARRRVAVGDVIVSSIEGSLNRIALIGQEYDQALCSTGFHVLNSKTLNSETLLVLMKSIIGQLQLKKGCSGTIHAAISRNELDRLILPIIPSDIQEHIKQRVAESSNLRKQSKHLLECAKRAVEIAIERDEQTAIDWLKGETHPL